MTIEQALELGVEHYNAGQFQQAEHLYRQVLRADPNHADALHLMGLLALRVGRIDVAIDLISRAVAVCPEAAPLHADLGEAFRVAGRFAEAEAAARRAVALDPRSMTGLANLGSSLLDQHNVAEAAGALRSVLELQPQHVEAHNNLGAALEKMDLLAEAEAEYRKAIQLDPIRVEGHVNLGSLLNQLGRPDDAVRCWEQAIAVNPEHFEAHWNLATGLLARGDFERGWPMHEWRLKRTIARKHVRSYDRPLWTGFDLTGKTILLHPEQGFGDTIQFARFAAPLAEMGAKVVLHMFPELVELMQTVDGVSRVVGRDGPLGEFYTHQYFMSLPSVLRTTLSTLPNKVPYIRVDPARQERFAGRIAAPGGYRKIGLAWAGKPDHADDKKRSMRLSALAPLADVPRAIFFSLQKGEAAREIAHAPFKIVDLQNDLRDFADTAAAIANLDLVICVDTAVAHVAGALGRPVWVLLPFAPDWRWMLDRDDSPWYPTMRLFRQTQRGDWSGPVNKIVDELTAHI